MDGKELIQILGLESKNNDEKFETKYANSRLNFGDIDSELMNRTPQDNDRPELERYFNSLYLDEEGLTEPVIFYGYVSNKKNNKKNSKSVVLINIVNEFGEIMAAHVWTKNDKIKNYIGEVIQFEGRIYKYQYVEKYGIAIIQDSIQVVESQQTMLSNSPWNNFRIGSKAVKTNELINEYLKGDNYERMMFLHQSERILDRISEDMFDISGMIYPLILNIYLMRDDTSDNNLIYSNSKHLSILTTVIIDYILIIRPSTYKELLYIITYLTLNYMGVNIDNPTDKNSRKYLRQTLNELHVNYDHAGYYIDNVIKNIGGNTIMMREYIPEFMKINPESLPDMARKQFAIRILSSMIPKDKRQFYLNKGFYLE